MPATITNPLPSGNRGVVPSKWQRRPAAEAFGDRNRPGRSRRRPADGIPLSRGEHAPLHVPVGAPAGRFTIQHSQFAIQILLLRAAALRSLS